MKQIKIFLTGIVVTLLLGSCTDYLEPSAADGTYYPEEFVWDNPSFSRGVLFQTYKDIPWTFRMYSNQFTEVATDDAVSNNASSAMRNLGLGSLSATYNPMDKWSTWYRWIRALNTFLENGVTTKNPDGTLNIPIYDTDSLTNARLIERYTGEAIFMRAWFHFNLLRLYGGTAANNEVLGVPVVKTILTEDESFALARNTYKETVEAIKEDCDEAMQYLPEEYKGADVVTGAQNTGAPTKNACRALKAMAYAFAASEAYQAVPSSDAALYLSEVLIDLDGALNSDALPTRSYSNPEDADVIWRSRFFADYSFEIQNFPPSFYGNGETNPSQNLVDSYYDINGYPITHESSVYDPSAPYANRENRLYADIWYDGSAIKGVTIDTYIGGKDSRSHYPVKGTKTGYYLKKFSSPDVELDPVQKGRVNSFNVMLGKTNLYLYLAEALHDMGYTNTASEYGVSAKDILAKVRKRAGFSPDPYLEEQATLGGQSFTDFIRNERRVELCFENHRFWDLRRWNLPVDGVVVRGMEITLQGDGTKSYNTVDVETRRFMSSSIPLPYHDVSLMPDLIQNKGW